MSLPASQSVKEAPTLLSFSHGQSSSTEGLLILEPELEDRQSLVEPGESLRNDIWPRSAAIWMAALYVAMFIIRPWEQLFPWLGTVHFERWIAIAMIYVVVSTRGFRHIFSFQSNVVFLFVASLGASYFFAQQPALGWNSFYVYLTLVVFYIVLVSVVRTPYELMFMVTSYIATMIVYLAKAQWEFFIHGQHRFDQGVTRMVGIEHTFGGPNSLAMSIVVSLPMLLLLYRVRHEIYRDWPIKYQKWFRQGLLVYAILALTSLALTNSRSGMVSFVAFIALIGLRGQNIGRRIGYCLAGAMFLVCAWLVLPKDIQDRYRTIWDPESGPQNAQVSAEGREAGFQAGIEMFKRFPLTGVGIGNFVDYRTRFVDGVPLQAHNLAGQLLGETGLVGTLGFVLLISAIFVNCRRTKSITKWGDDDTHKVLFEFADVARMSALLLLVTGLFGHNLYRFNWLWLAAFCLLACEFGHRAQAASIAAE